MDNLNQDGLHQSFEAVQQPQPPAPLNPQPPLHPEPLHPEPHHPPVVTFPSYHLDSTAAEDCYIPSPLSSTSPIYSPIYSPFQVAGGGSDSSPFQSIGGGVDSAFQPVGGVNVTSAFQMDNIGGGSSYQSASIGEEAQFQLASGGNTTSFQAATNVGADNSYLAVGGGRSHPIQKVEPSASLSLPKKRGRPRKYHNNTNIPLTTGLVQSPPSQAADGLNSAPPAKRGRGRPRGSGTAQRQRHPYHDQMEQLEGLGTMGYAFTPHVFHVQAGEDLAAKIMAFAKHGPKDIVVLSATGSVSQATVRVSGGTVTHEGVFDIVALSGSFILRDVDGQPSRTGGLCITLCNEEGKFSGGGVAGLVIASSHVQISCASFISETKKEVKRAAAAAMVNASGGDRGEGAAMVNASGGDRGEGGEGGGSSQATESESSGGGPPPILRRVTGMPGLGMPWN